jgi:DNA-binding CsgD family transcriptional regulator
MIDANAFIPGTASRQFNRVLPLGIGRSGSADSGWPDSRPLPDRCLAAVLDELDYGILLLVDGGSRVASLNHAAREELDDDHPLRLSEGRLEARLACDTASLRSAIEAAFGQGLRRLVTVGSEGHRTSVSIVPLAGSDDAPSAVLVILGKSAVCEALSISGFCHSHGLTWAESRVLTELCAGTAPKEIARQLDVSITTVRTHILSMRAKTDAPSVAALLSRVAILPPLRRVLRGAPSVQEPATIHSLECEAA